MTQAALAQVVHREPLTISRWERGEDAIGSNAETLIRVCATQELGLPTDTKVTEISGWCIQGDPAPKPIIIDGTTPVITASRRQHNETTALVGGPFIWGCDRNQHRPICQRPNSPPRVSEKRPQQWGPSRGRPRIGTQPRDGAPDYSNSSKGAKVPSVLIPLIKTAPGSVLAPFDAR
jgi:hypothetical protein